MSVIQPLNRDNNDKLQEYLIKELSEIRKNMLDITEYSNREIKAISVLSMNPFMKRFFCSNSEKDLSLVENKKHIKRKFEKTLLKMDKNRSNVIANISNENEGKFFNFFNRDKRK